MSAICNECGVAIEEGAFLGLCPDCNQGKGQAAAAPMVSSASGGKGGLKIALIAGAVFLVLGLMGTYFWMGSDAGEPAELAPVIYKTF